MVTVRVAGVPTVMEAGLIEHCGAIPEDGCTKQDRATEPLNVEIAVIVTVEVEDPPGLIVLGENATKKFQFPGAWRVENAAPFYSGFRNPFESNETLGVSKRFFLGERVNAELRVEFENVLNRMRVCGGDHMDNNPYDVAGLDPNNTNFNFGIVSPGAVCQGNTPRRGQAFFRVTF